MESGIKIPGETYEIRVGANEYYQLKKKLMKGKNETVVRLVNSKLCVCTVLDTVNDKRVVVAVQREL